MVGMDKQRKHEDQGFFFWCDNAEGAESELVKKLKAKRIQIL